MLRTLHSGVFLLCFSFNAICQSQTAVPPTAANSSAFSPVQVEASFPGGREGWIAYLTANLKANTPVKKKAPAGTYQVIVRFMVATDGSISDVMAETNHGYGMEAEVIRIISKGPKWNPAMEDGKPLNAYRRQPVTFVVQGR